VTDYGAVALKIIGKVALTGGGGRQTLLARREGGQADICALLLQDGKSGYARHAVSLTGTALDRLKYGGTLGATWLQTNMRYDAGTRFRSHWHDGGQEPNLSMRYEHGDGPRAGEMSHDQEIIYEYWRGCCRRIGPFANVVVSVCCFDYDPGPTGLPTLLTGLDILAFQVYA